MLSPAQLSDRLETSLQVVRSPVDTDPYKMLAAAERLVAHGRFEEARIGLIRSASLLRRRGIRFASMEALEQVNRRLHKAGVARRLAELGEIGRRLASVSEEAVLVPALRSRRLLVVFGSMFGDYWLSYPVLHCLLPLESTTVLYLRDPSNMMFLNGLSFFGGGFDALCEGVRALAAEHALDDIRVMAFSSGGFGGLLFASRMRASGYLGLSIRTDLDPQSGLPNDRYVARSDLLAAAGDLMMDLKPLLQRPEHSCRGILYYGARSEIDMAHALHLEGVPGFTINGMPDSLHNTVMNLVAEGKFDGMVRKFLS